MKDLPDFYHPSAPSFTFIRKGQDVIVTGKLVRSGTFGNRDGYILHDSHQSFYGGVEQLLEDGCLSVAYGNGRWVIVVDTSQRHTAFLTSTNGIDWFEIHNIPPRKWMAVCYGNGLFVAVANDATTTECILTSPDGLNWTLRKSPVMNFWTHICYGNGRFVAVASASGAHQYALVSENGIDWTAAPVPSSQYYYSVCYGNGKFLAVGSISFDRPHNSLISPDGYNWSYVDIPFDDVVSVCYGNGQFVAVGYDGGDVHNIATSPNGEDWTLQESPTSNEYSDVCYDSSLSLYVATISHPGTLQKVVTSPNGSDWTLRTVPSDSMWCRVATDNNGFFVAVSLTGPNGYIMTSPNGADWTLRYGYLDSRYFQIDSIHLFCSAPGPQRYDFDIEFRDNPGVWVPQFSTYVEKSATLVPQKSFSSALKGVSRYRETFYNSHSAYDITFFSVVIGLLTRCS